MIISERDECFRLIQQVDHARFAGELAALWVNGDLRSHPRRSEILFAIRQHDNGWNEVDSVPLCDGSSGRPVGFANMPLARRLEIWRLGPLRYSASHPYSALLILRHAVELHRHETSDPATDAWRSLVDFWSALEQELLGATNVSREEIERDYLWLRCADQLSLAICAEDLSFLSQEVAGVRLELVRRGALQLDALIDPFPFAGKTSFEVGCRSIPARRYSGDGDLAGALIATRWQRMRVRVASLL